MLPTKVHEEMLTVWLGRRSHTTGNQIIMTGGHIHKVVRVIRSTQGGHISNGLTVDGVSRKDYIALNSRAAIKCTKVRLNAVVRQSFDSDIYYRAHMYKNVLCYLNTSLFTTPLMKLSHFQTPPVNCWPSAPTSGLAAHSLLFNTGLSYDIWGHLTFNLILSIVMGLKGWIIQTEKVATYEGPGHNDCILLWMFTRVWVKGWGSGNCGGAGGGGGDENSSFYFTTANQDIQKQWSS
jgi:hypothetical protein